VTELDGHLINPSAPPGARWIHSGFAAEEPAHLNSDPGATDRRFPSLDFQYALTDFGERTGMAIAMGDTYAPLSRDNVTYLKHLSEYVTAVQLPSDLETWPDSAFLDALHWLLRNRKFTPAVYGKIRESFTAFVVHLLSKNPSLPFDPVLLQALPIQMLSRRMAEKPVAGGTGSLRNPFHSGKRAKYVMDLSGLGTNLAAFLKQAEEFVADLRFTKRASSPNTGKRYGIGVRHLILFLKKQDLDLTPRQITERLYNEFVTYQQLELALDQSTIAGNFNALRRFYKYLVKSRYITEPENVFRNIEGTGKPKGLPRPMQCAEIEKFLQTFNTADIRERRDLVVFELIYGSGLRISEAVSARVNQFIFDEIGLGSSVTVRGKGGKVRKVPLSVPFENLLRSWISDLGLTRDSYVFPSRKVKTPHYRATSFEKRFKIYLERAGLDPHYNPHMLRHSFATHMMDGGADLRSLQELLGHACLATVGIYLQVSTKRKYEVHAKAHPRNQPKPTIGPSDPAVSNVQTASPINPVP